LETDAQGKPLLAVEVNGKFAANVIVTFGSSASINLEVTAHEGSHVEDHQKFISALEAATAKNPSLTDADAKSLPENLTKYATESKAYHVSSYIAEYSKTPNEFWDKGMQEADRQKAIDQHLKSSALYKITPKPGGQGPRLYETKQ
jgi:hypothetical protein